MKLKIFSVLLIVTCLCGTLAARPISVNASSFNANNLMDDGIFYNTNTMGIIQIDNFLNTFPNSCISPSSGFSAPDPTGYNPTNGFLYGKNVSAGQVIYDAAQAYGLNPQVLLTTLEKEEGLVDGTGLYGCSTTAIASAVGYGCPDGSALYSYSNVGLYSTGTTFDSNFNVVNSGTEVTSINSTCVNSSLKVGFSQQIIHATWLFRFAQERSRGNIGWDVQKTNQPQPGDSWDNSDDPQSCYSGPMTQGTWQICPSGSTSYYDGYTTIDGTSVHMDTGATAALYWYTPHFSGNQNFDNIFTAWFGGIYSTPYYAGYSSQSNYPVLNPGQQSVVYILYQNLGTQTWYDDTSIASAPAGAYPVHLATSSPLNRISVFSSGWPSGNRAAVNFSAVYESDGTTQASNQHVAQPGQIVKFSVTVTVPDGQSPATYKESFMPIAEGSTSGLFNDPGTFLNIIVNPVPSMGFVGQSAYPTIAPGIKSAAYILLRNDGNVALYDDSALGSASAGTEPVHLATANPINSSSPFSQDWPSVSRAAYDFSAVYNADGSTLAPNQHVAQPGQIVKFSFNLDTPPQYASGSYNQYLQPILEGSPTGALPYLGIYLTIAVPSTPVISATSSFPNISVAANQPTQISISIENIGNSSTDTSAILTTTSGAYQTSSWLSMTQIMDLPQALSPGQSVAVSVPILAPGASSANTPFICGVSDSGAPLPLASGCQTNIVISAPTYSAAYVSESPAPLFTYGQTANVYFSYKNTGNQPWFDDTSLSASTWRNPSLVHLATSHPLNRTSGFSSGWPSSNRPATTFSAVFNSDGYTLASDQHVVQPGQIVKFSFGMRPEAWVQPGVTREYFTPVVEGSQTGLINDVWTFLDVAIQPYTYSAQYSTESASVTMSAGQQTTVFLTYKNTGYATWYDDSTIGSAPSSTPSHPVHLATSHPLNRTSGFSSGWPSSNRPATTFSAVFNSDGYTLASDQHVVQPGQIVKFSFTLTAPLDQPKGEYSEYFQPVADGSSNGLFNDPYTFLTVNIN